LDELEKGLVGVENENSPKILRKDSKGIREKRQQQEKRKPLCGTKIAGRKKKSLKGLKPEAKQTKRNCLGTGPQNRIKKRGGKGQRGGEPKGNRNQDGEKKP